jgi:hypothetical protein
VDSFGARGVTQVAFAARNESRVVCGRLRGTWIWHLCCLWSGMCTLVREPEPSDADVAGSQECTYEHQRSRSPLRAAQAIASAQGHGRRNVSSSGGFTNLLEVVFSRSGTPARSAGEAHLSGNHSTPGLITAASSASPALPSNSVARLPACHRSCRT